MYVCTHTNIYNRRVPDRDLNMCTWIPICIHTCINVCVYICMCICNRRAQDRDLRHYLQVIPTLTSGIYVHRYTHVCARVRLCVCVCIGLCACGVVCNYIELFILMSTMLCIFMQIYAYIQYVCIHAYMYINIYKYIYIYIYICIYIHVCIYIYLYVQKHTHTHTHTHTTTWQQLARQNSCPCLQPSHPIYI